MSAAHSTPPGSGGEPFLPPAAAAATDTRGHEGLTGAPANSEFLRELLSAAPLGSYGWVCNFSGTPNTGSEWHGRPYRGGGELEQQVDTWQRYNTYFSVAAFMPGEGGEQARRKALFTRLLALVVDDATLERLIGRPSWVLETSPNNFQIGILLDADDPDCANVALVDALMRKLFDEGLIGGDKSGNNAARYVRLPMGQNQKQRPSGHFDHTMRQWNPNQRVSLADAASMLGVDLDELRASAQAQAETGRALGPMASGGDKMAALAGNIVQGIALHDSINELTASLVANGLHGGAATNMARGLMDVSLAPRDDRWLERYRDIPRAVRTAEEKYAPARACDQSQMSIDATREARSGAGDEPVDEAALRPLDLRLLASSKPAGVDFKVAGWLPEGAVALFASHGGTGKSFIANIELAVCLAAGLSWYGAPTKRSRVMVFSAEDDTRVLHDRLNRVCAKHDVDLAELSEWLYIYDVTTIDTELFGKVDVRTGKTGPLELMKWLGRTVDALEIDVLVVDNASDTFAGDEIKRSDVKGFIRALVALVRPRNGSVVLLAHVSKASVRFGGKQDQEDYSGSTAWPNSARSRWSLRAEDDGTLLMSNPKTNWGKKAEPISLRWDEATSTFVPTSVGLGALSSRTPGPVDKITVLDLLAEFSDRGEHIATGPTSPSNAYRMLYREPSYPIGLKRPALVDLLRQLERDKLIARVEVRTAERKMKEVWQVTVHGRVLCGRESAPSAPSAPTAQVYADGAGGDGVAPSAPTGAGVVGGSAHAEDGSRDGAGFGADKARTTFKAHPLQPEARPPTRGSSAYHEPHRVSRRPVGLSQTDVV